MAKRMHAMPFGAHILEDGRVRFRLWAPGAEAVDLVISASEQVLPMHADAEGWFERVTDRARAGTHYRYRIDTGQQVPDPASRFQPHDVHGPSQVLDPRDWHWQDSGWRGRPWHEAVVYELHVGSFSPQGTWDGVTQRLDALVELGVTAIELMPIGDFPGRRNWGYDGVLPFAPDSRYGTPEQLKDLIQTAHSKGLMVLLDVVYNHFGPEGNYLHLYAPQFFTERHHTPWGAAINYDDAGSEVVRQFFIHNALYWLEEYHFDGLRLDAVHAIFDDSRPDVLQTLAQAVQDGPGRTRHIHLVLENDRNAAHYLERDRTRRPRWYVAQWNDDIHHAFHVLLTGEDGGYYADYAEQPGEQLGRCLSEGFAFQGQPSAYRDGARRGEPSAHLPAGAFVNFLQNHDQIGNRALGERLHMLSEPQALRAATAVLLLAPSPPLLYMGQEWAASAPFLFFCDFGEELAAKVTAGRRKEFARFPEFSDPAARERIPDPNAAHSFERSCLDWSERDRAPHRDWLALHRELLWLRRELLFPRLRESVEQEAGFQMLAPRALHAHWTFAAGTRLEVLANLGTAPVANVALPPGAPIYRDGPDIDAALTAARLPPWSVVWYLGDEA